jgi:hypothetical protein
MLKNFNLRNQRIKEDIDFLIEVKGKRFVEAIEMTAFKYGLENETTEKIYCKVEKKVSKTLE